MRRNIEIVIACYHPPFPFSTELNTGFRKIISPTLNIARLTILVNWRFCGKILRGRVGARHSRFVGSVDRENNIVGAEDLHTQNARMHMEQDQKRSCFLASCCFSPSPPLHSSPPLRSPPPLSPLARGLPSYGHFYRCLFVIHLAYFFLYLINNFQ